MNLSIISGKLHDFSLLFHRTSFNLEDFRRVLIPSTPPKLSTIVGLPDMALQSEGPVEAKTDLADNSQAL